MQVLKRIQQREIAPNWSVATALFFAAGYVVMWIAGFTIVSVASGEIDGRLTPGTLAFGACIGMLAASLSVVQWARRRGGVQWQSVIRLNPVPTANLIFVFLFSLGLAWAVSLIGILLQFTTTQVIPPTYNALREPISAGWFAALILALILQPLADGLIFGGLVYPVVARTLPNNILAIAATAIIYTSVSLFIAAEQNVWFAIIEPFLMGLSFISVRAFTQSTRAAIVARVAFGVFFLAAALISA
jgi:hypothetical protein